MRYIASVVLSVFVVFSFLSCSSKSGNLKSHGLKGAPEWVLTQGVDGETYGVGSAKITNENISWAMKEATTKGTAELAGIFAQKIEEKTKILEKDGNTESVRAIRQSVDKLLAGATRTATWVSDTGVLYAKVQIKEIDNKLLKKNLQAVEKVDKEAAKALSEVVDEIIDGKK